MSEGRYQLEALLTLRERARDEAERALADVLHEVTHARARLTQLEGALERQRSERVHVVNAHLEQATETGAEAASFVLMRRYEARLERSEAEAEAACARQVELVQQAELRLEARREALAHAQRELEALRRHHEAWARQRRAERERRAEDAQDEVAQALHRARTRG